MGMRFLQDDVTVIHSDEKEAVVYADILDLYTNREKSAAVVSEPNDPLVSIYFQAYNHLEDYTKPALDALLRYTADIDYELILVDNGSTDGTFEYFQSLPYPRKRIYRITKNIGAFFGYRAAKNATQGRFLRGKYFVGLPNDILVTKNWLQNMLICMESDERIGFVVPMSDNVSNLQYVNLGYSDFGDMQEKAALFNVSDPRKWYDRLRLIPTVCVIRTYLRELYEADYAFVYDFADDDISFAYRRLGYRIVLCSDTFVHHEGSTIVGVNQQEHSENLEKGRILFRRKYGVDAWSDVVNFEVYLRRALFEGTQMRENARILGIDVRCGTPLLELRNTLRENGMNQTVLTAYTTEPQYWQDLASFCEGGVYCGDIDRLSCKIGDKTYDYIIMGTYMDCYEDVLAVIRSAAAHLSDGGALVCKMRNYDVPYDLQEIALALQNMPPRLVQGMYGCETELLQLPYEVEIYPYMEEVYDLKERFFAQLREVEAYQNDAHIRAVFSEERFDALMTQYAVVLRKRS